MTPEQERRLITAQRQMTKDGRSAFSKMDESERGIVAWLMNLPADWPFTGPDIAEQMLAGWHKSDPTQGTK